MSLYRTYRPTQFADVIGQDHIVTTLEQAAGQDKLAHAYLFAGSRGTGKTSVARILAKTIMTKGIEDTTLSTQIEKGVEEGSIVDLLEIDAASNRGIDDVRDLIEKIQFSPVVAGAKVYIIDEVHMLTKEAFNALLKTLEEPPPYAFFILCTTELNKIPVTIQSRCQCFPFRRIRDEDIIRRLQYIADSEKISIERDALRTIAGHVEGGMRDAISLLDQLRSLESISVEDVKQRAGSTGQEYVEDILEALGNDDREKLVATVRTVEEAGIPMDIFMRILLTEARSALHKAVENKESTAEILGVIDILLDAIRDVRSAPVPGLVVESALLTICGSDAGAPAPTKKQAETVAKQQEPEPTKAKKEQKVKKVEAEVTDETTDEVTEQSTEMKANTEEPETDSGLIEAKELSKESLQESWSEILKQTEPASVRMSLKDSTIDKIDGKKLTLSFASAFHRDRVAETEASRAVEKVIENIFKQSLHLECQLDEHGTTTAGETDTEEVNLADAAAEIF